MLDVRADIKDVTRYLDRIQRKQVPLATSQALNNTAFYVRGKEQQEAKKRLHKPTKFTLNGFQYKKASKTKLWATVFVEPKRWEYLQYQIDGGTRKKRSDKGEAVPVNIPLNDRGNITGRKGGKILKLMKRPDTFVGNVKGVYGLWQRGNINAKGKFSMARKRKNGTRAQAKNLKLLVRLEQTVSYKKRLDFKGIARRHANKRFPWEFKRQMARALASAK